MHSQSQGIDEEHGALISELSCYLALTNPMLGFVVPNLISTLYHVTFCSVVPDSKLYRND